MVIRALVASLLLAVGAAPASAWTTQTGGGTVLIRHQDQGFTIEMRCQRANPGVLGFRFAGPALARVSNVTSVNLYATFPNGNIVSDVVPVTQTGSVAEGTWNVGPQSLELFAQGTGLGVGLNGPVIVMRTNMTGTAAARAAIRSQCGF